MKLIIKDKISKLFPDVIAYKMDTDSSKIYVELQTNFEWNIDTARAFQTIILDRHPDGYAGPLNFDVKKIDENLLTITWNCYDVSG